MSLELLSNEVQIDPAGNRDWTREFLPEMGSSLLLQWMTSPRLFSNSLIQFIMVTNHLHYRPSASLNRIKEDRKRNSGNQEMNPSVACTTAWPLSQHRTELCISHVSSKHAKLSRPRASETRFYLTLHQASSLTVMTVLWAAFQRTLYFEGEQRWEVSPLPPQAKNTKGNSLPTSWSSVAPEY